MRRYSLEKLAEMKKAFFEVWKGIEEEGPREWWESEPQRKKKPAKPKKGAALGEGKDESGDWPLVKGGAVTKAGLGHVLDASGGEAIAVATLDPPVTGTVTFKVEYQAAVDGKTLNALFCFGAKPDNNSLFKAGTMIGMGRHGIFQGGWGNVSRGANAAAKFDPTGKFTAHVVVDLSKHTAVLEVGETRLEYALPADLKEIAYYGLYAKGTKSTFSKVEVVR